MARRLAQVSPAARLAPASRAPRRGGPAPRQCRLPLSFWERKPRADRPAPRGRPRPLLRGERQRLTQAPTTSQPAADRLGPALQGQIARKGAALASLELFDSLNYKSVLDRGFAVVHDADGRP